ncbi:hypothetical protein [Flavobacterium soyangense]|uniref:Uncharacterized protein n=1 Tax=Flavobacterium soyangense TaxID=2023265 RepID=A0A930UE71_9FLAO|nr:hypothetical protein [Flavobacterium soyangense]MBF2709779.1 hypothetical protein [Flavobacterium soyangense]
MKKNNFFLIATLIICSNNLFGQAENNKFDPSLNEVQKWFTAWDLVYNDVYVLKKIKPVDFVLFDETYVYTTSKITGKDGLNIVGPSLSDMPLTWTKKIHNGKITLPDSTDTEVKVMSFASQLANGSPYFVMPLTSYWLKNKVDDHGIGLETLVTCVFLHEFGHTQQLQSLNDIGKVMEAYSKVYPNDNLNDDILQFYYKNDSIYLKDYKIEADLFRQAALTLDKNERINLTRTALQMLKVRQKKCFEKDGRDIAKMDDFFLTLEGIGQYTAFSWLIHPKGGNLSIDKALIGIKTKWWSQEQGFDTIFLLSKFMKPKKIANYMFGKVLTTSIDLLEKQVKN